MKHQKAFRKLTRTPAHRRAMLRNLATSLVLQDEIETTLPKAKELRRVVDKLVTLGKKDTLHNRRKAMQYLMQVDKKSSTSKTKWTAVHRLFTEVAPRYTERDGGYTRVVRTRVRSGDAAQMAYIGFVEAGAVASKSAPKKRRTARSTKKVAPTTEEVTEAAPEAAVAKEAAAETASE